MVIGCLLIQGSRWPLTQYRAGQTGGPIEYMLDRSRWAAVGSDCPGSDFQPVGHLRADPFAGPGRHGFSPGREKVTGEREIGSRSLGCLCAAEDAMIQVDAGGTL